MKLKIDIQWHIIAALAAIVAVAFRLGSILEHREWEQGKAQVTGRIDDIQASRQIRLIRYSYEIDGRKYQGEVADRNRFTENTFATVTYARSNPAVSTILPDQIESIYRNSWIVIIVAATPLLVMIGIEIGHRFRRRP